MKDVQDEQVVRAGVNINAPILNVSIIKITHLWVVCDLEVCQVFFFSSNRCVRHSVLQQPVD